MPIGVSPYPRSVLPDDHWEALYQAQRDLVDLVLDDLGDLAHGTAFADLSIADYLPRRDRRRYDDAFLRKFLVCLVSEGLKLRLPGVHPLGGTAEGIALFVIKQRAAERLTARGTMSAWRMLKHEWLFATAKTASKT